MSRVLLDENIPLGLARMLRDHEVRHVLRLGWDGVENGDLIAKAEQEGFQVIVTGDQNLRYQQNLRDRRLAIIVLSTNRWIDIQRSTELVLHAIDCSETGGFRLVEIARVKR